MRSLGGKRIDSALKSTIGSRATKPTSSAPERDAIIRAHTPDEEKHTSGTVTTQLCTPRWIAGFLAKTCLDAHHMVSDTISDSDFIAQEKREVDRQIEAMRQDSLYQV